MKGAAVAVATRGAFGLGVAAVLIAVAASAGAYARLPLVPIWWLAMVAAALGVVAAGWAGPWRRAALVAGVFLLGASSQLALTAPTWYPLLQIRPRSAFSYLYYAGLALQAAAAAAFAGRLAGPAWRTASRLGRARLGVLLAVLLAASAGALPFVAKFEVLNFGQEVVGQAVFLGINAATLVAYVVACPAPALDRLSRFWTDADPLAGPWARLHRLAPWFGAAFVLAVSTALCLTAFDRLPRIPDEVDYLFQARYLAAGRIWLPAPPPAVAAALEQDWAMVYRGRWFSIFPPGWPAALALGVKAGAPWLVNPILGAATILVSHAFLKRVAPAGVATLGTILISVSPWWLEMSASYCSHVLTTFLTVAAWLLLAQSPKGAAGRWFAAGALMGWVFLTRPVDGLLAGGLTGMALLIAMDRRSGRAWAALVAYGLGCVAVGALVFPYDAALTGHPLTTPITYYFNTLWGAGSNRMGFGSDIGPPDLWRGLDVWRGHSPLEALVNSQYNLTELHRELFGWAVGSIGLAVCHLLWGRQDRLDWAMWTLSAATVAAYGLYWHHGALYIGPRYWFVMLWPMVYLSARGAFTMAGRLDAVDALGGGRLAAALVLSIAVALVSFISWRGAARFWEFRDSHGHFRAVAASGRLGDAVVFVRSESMGELGSAFVLNPLDLDAPQPLFLKDRGPAANAAAAAALPGRPVLHMDGRGRLLGAAP